MGDARRGARRDRDGRDPRRHHDRGRRRLRGDRRRTMTEVRVLRVFMDAAGGGGNALGVVLDGGARRGGPAPGGGGRARLLGDGVRRRRRLGGDPDLHARGRAGVRRASDRGTGWLLRDLGLGGSILRCPAGDVATWQDGDLSWIRARPEWIHPITRAQLASPAAVDALTGPPPGEGSYYPWAWIDEAGGDAPGALLRAGLRHRGGRGDGRRRRDDGRAARAAARDPPGDRVGAPRPARAGRHGRGRRTGRGHRHARGRDAGMSDAVDPAVRPPPTPARPRSTTARRT